MSLHQWLTDLHTSCLKETFKRERTFRDEQEAFEKLGKACASGGPLESVHVVTFSGQSGSPEHLNLITLHSAKGLEFDVVIMMGMDQGRIPRWNQSSEAEKQERGRLFYVGLTRARYEAHLTYSGWTANQYGRRFEHGPSEFLLEVQRKLSG